MHTYLYIHNAADLKPDEKVIKLSEIREYVEHELIAGRSKLTEYGQGWLDGFIELNRTVELSVKWDVDKPKKKKK